MDMHVLSPSTDIDLRDGASAVATIEAPPAAERRPQPAGTPRSSAWRKIDLQAAAAQVLLAVSALAVGFLVFVLFLSTFPEKRAQTGLERGFATSLAKHKAPIGGPIPNGKPVARLDIARLGLHQIVVEGTSADQLRKGPGHVPVTPLPGQPGNAVLAGHDRVWGGPFSGLDRLRPGVDTITVLTGQGSFTYKVSFRHEVASTDVDPFSATNDNRLTLLTAANLTASRRLVVVATLSGGPKAAPPGRPPVLSSHDGGLVGQRNVLPTLALWLEVLLITAIATVVLYRRLPLWSSYLITTPVVLAVVWLVYANLARLLPATL